MTYLFFLISIAVESNQVLIIMTGLAIALLSLSLLNAPKLYVALSFTFIFFSLWLIWYYKIPWTQGAEGIIGIVKIVLFMSIVPFVSVSVRNYVPTIKKFILAIRSKYSEFRICHYTSFFLGNFMNLGTLPICKNFFFDEVKDKPHSFIKASLTARSYSLAMLCTPAGAAIAIAMSLTNTSWGTMLLVNLPLIILGLALSLLFEKKKIDFTERDSFASVVTIEKNDKVMIIKAFLPLIIYFSILMIIDSYSTWDLALSLLVTVLPFSFLWSIFLRDLQNWKTELISQVFVQAPKSFPQFSVIISAGLFVHLLEYSRLSVQIRGLLPVTDTWFSSIVYIPMICIAVLSLSLIGIHQFVSMIFIGGLIDFHALNIHPAVFSSILLIGFVSSMMASSFSGVNLLLSNLLKNVSPSSLARSHYLYVSVFLILSSVLLIGINLIIS